MHSQHQEQFNSSPAGSAVSGDSRGRHNSPTATVHIKSTEPDRIIELPIIQNINLQTRVIDKPEIVIRKKFVDKIQVEEKIQEVPQVHYVEKDKVIEIPEIRYVSKIVHVPQIITKIIEVPKYELQEVVVEVPKLVTKYVEKIVEMPQIEWVDRLVEKEKIVEEIKYVPKIKIIEVPVEKVRHVPKIEVRTVEKIRHVPGQIEYREIPIDKPVYIPRARPVEVIKQRFVPKNVYLDVEINLPVPGDVISVPFDVETPAIRIIPNYVPGRVIDRQVRVPVEKIIEIPVPQEQTEFRVVKRERRISKEVIKEIDVIHKVQKIVDVPRYVYIEGPKTIIEPKLIKKYNQLPDTKVTQAPQYSNYDEHLPPVYSGHRPDFRPPSAPIPQSVALSGTLEQHSWGSNPVDWKTKKR